ncbi:MAG: monofunctional biosynthetic peptidoglycan transglycosylase [Parvularculaceae bacterium]
MARKALKSREKSLLRLIAMLAALPAAASIVWIGLYGIINPSTTYIMRAQARAGLEIKQEWRALDEISPHLIAAVIAAEDQKFCSHFGFDIDAMRKAADDALANGIRRGGSTITQQTAKNVFLWPGRNVVRKGLEAWFALLMEAMWPKERILELYLNVAEWGPGVFGAEAAARHYYGRPASRLTPTQAARLAAVLPSPKKWSANPPDPHVIQRAARIARHVRRSGAYLARCVD